MNEASMRVRSRHGENPRKPPNKVLGVQVEANRLTSRSRQKDHEPEKATESYQLS